jgi:hypothetical protein
LLASTAPPPAGKSHLAQALGFCAIQQGHRAIYREAHVLLEELADAGLDGNRKSMCSSSRACCCLSSMTSACASSARTPPKSYSSSSCDVTNARARSSLRTGRLMAGASASATSHSLSAPRSHVASRPRGLSAGHAASERVTTHACRLSRRRSSSQTQRRAHRRLAEFVPIITNRISVDHRGDEARVLRAIARVPVDAIRIGVGHVRSHVKGRAANSPLRQMRMTAQSTNKRPTQ